MVAGYATFQTQLKVTGSSTVTSNWDIQITNVTEGTPTGSAENAVAPSFDKLWASMEANLYDKGDAMEYDVTIENKGTLDAKLNDIITNLENSNNEAVIITFSGYTKGEILKSGESKIVHVKIEYNPEYEGGETSSEVEINFDYTQNNNEENNPDNQYLLTYDYQTNGGQSVDLNQEYLVNGSNVDLSNTATKEGWTFVGWNTDKDAEIGLKSYQMPAGNTTLYAIYSKTLNVTYEQGENVTSIGKTNDSCNIYNNQTSCEITLPSITTSNGYIPDGWYNGEEKIGSPNEKYTIKEDTTLTGKAIEDIITLTISTTATTNSITVIANATSPSGIAKYEYSKDGGKTWEEGITNTYTFTGLTQGTSYDIVVRVTNNTGKTLEKSTTVDITSNVVTTGDGLYEDEYEDGRYIYRGTNPNNYIWFNDEMWRIIAKEADGTYKIIKNGSLGNMTFDSSGYRDASSNGAGGTYCINSNYGCNAWAKNDYFVSGTFSGTVLKDAELNTYLNNTFYNQLSKEYKNLIANHTYNVGPVLAAYDGNINDEPTSTLIQEEQAIKWTGNIGLINISEYLLANSNQNSCGTIGTTTQNIEICKTTNWIQQIVENTNHKYAWAISATANYVQYVQYIFNDFIIENRNTASDDYLEVIPVLYLNSNITLSGSGTQSNPYQINKGTSTSTLEKPTYTESGTYGKTITITYPKGCGNGLTCSYQKDNGKVVNVTEGTVDVEFSVDGNIVATVSDGINTVSSSYAVDVTNASDQLEAKVVTTGQGIYDDIYEENHYVYKGANPDNYIRFNNELWRIISTEQDDTIKIIRNDSLGKMKYDEPGSRSLVTNTGTFCTSDSGCNAYGITNDFGGLGTVLKDSTLNTYLNGEYYNGLTSDAKSYIIDHDFPNGYIGDNGTNGDKVYVDDAQNREKKILWHGNIGLMNLTDYFRGTLDSACDSVYSGWQVSGYPCHNDNYLFKDGDVISTMTSTHGISDLWTVNYRGSICSGGTECGWVYLEQSIYPVVYLRNTIYLTGNGTESSPYIIYDILS